MKIAILTQPAGTNYGGILQNWALQQVLRRMGHEPVTVNRWYDEPPLSLRLVALRCVLNLKNFVRRWVRGCKWYTFCRPWSRVFICNGPRFCDSRFVRRITSTRWLYSDSDLRREMEHGGYEAFVVGSDQVWRRQYSPRLQTYFLDFVPEGDSRPKVAYAASFGTDPTDIDADCIDECRMLLARFDGVSVREDGGVCTAREVLGREDATRLCDPTLLLGKEDYEALLPADAQQLTPPYIASYILDDQPFKAAIVDHVSEASALGVRRAGICYDGKRLPTVGQWIALFARASWVVTDSFHGCVFATIFRKPFIAIGNADRGLDRFTSLLSMLGLPGRMVLTLEDFEARKSQLLAAPDMAAVGGILERERARSMEFLARHLGPGTSQNT